jgi:hypothetical protein
MTIRRGRDWGAPGRLATDAPVVATDAGLAAAWEAGAREVGLVGGDLHRTLGSPRHDEASLRRGEGTRCAVDMGEAELTRADGRVEVLHFVAHAVATTGPGPLFRARTVVAMNATHRGGQDLGPRAHPNDGLLDVTDGRLGLGESLRAYRRMPTGSHLPHPRLTTSRTRELTVDLPGGARVALDGVAAGRAVRLVLRCLPDALVVVA